MLLHSDSWQRDQSILTRNTEDTDKQHSKLLNRCFVDGGYWLPVASDSNVVSASSSSSRQCTKVCVPPYIRENGCFSFCVGTYLTPKSHCSDWWRPVMVILDVWPYHLYDISKILFLIWFTSAWHFKVFTVARASSSGLWCASPLLDHDTWGFIYLVMHCCVYVNVSPRKEEVGLVIVNFRIGPNWINYNTY
jgi:hypothetical protein